MQNALLECPQQYFLAILGSYDILSDESYSVPHYHFYK